MTPGDGRTPVLAEFASPDALRSAAERLRAMGYRRIELFSPYPISGAEEILGLRRPKIPGVVLAGGVAGAILGVVAQWYPNAWAYPLNVGGRPLLALPAWVPVTFELGVLGAAFGAMIGLLVWSHLPRLWDPRFEVEEFDRVTYDRFWIEIDPRDPRFDPERTRRELESIGALRVETVEAAS